MYRLLALDMDDTVLNDKRILTDTVKEELQRLIHNKIEVTLASGRFPASLWLHAKYIGLKTPLVALNGGAIVDPFSGESLKSNYIDFPVCLKIGEYVQSKGSYVQFYGYNVLYVEKINEENRMWPLKNVVINPGLELNFENYRSQVHYIKLKEVGNINAFIKSERNQIIKATVLDENPERLKEIYHELNSWNELCITLTGNRRFDINAYGVSKKAGLEEICSEKGIRPEEVVAVGDYDNDLEMIKWAGLGVAMGNGNENVKMIADYITLENTRDGVAYLIKEKILPHKVSQN